MFKKSRTFRLQKVRKNDAQQKQLEEYAEATLGSGNLRSAVTLPEGENQNEWFAAHIADFFNQINMIYGTITEFCTPQSCPVMTAGPKYEYHWADGVTVKKPIKLSAPEYIERMMSWIQKQIDNEEVFPTELGKPFPKNFPSISKTIFKRLFRVYGHIYHHHFNHISLLGEEAHLNTSFKHFIFFVIEFKLIEKKEMIPLKGLIKTLVKNQK
ncbi:mob kinase activator-like 1 [Anaeramoeba ignava]|uniref:Mob kinase activator-like 1 n=1 Tax=Anaeramoeba ignava TaxID=1746090 RepID=A0A9Q0L4W2_ANAIG|nr:mob kinase activator-like 1 [Anaeramoeba ignava]